MTDTPSQTNSLFATMLGSALSGLVARIPCHGLDTLKARVQQNNQGTLVSILRDLLRLEGWLGLYRGFGVAMMGSLPGSCLYFTSYEVLKERLSPALPPVMAHLCAGLGAEAASCFLFVPVDVIKERMQVQSLGGPIYYRNTRDAVAQIIQGGEGLGGLYRGYWATLASFGPFSALYFALYEGIKSRVSGEGQQQPMPLSTLLLVAGSAGAGASLLTNPLDLVKLRLQVQRGGGYSDGPEKSHQAHRHYKGLLDGVRAVLFEEGWRGLFRGAGVRMVFHTASTAISVSCFEECKASVARLGF